MEESKEPGKGMSRGTLPGPTLCHGLETGFGEQDKDGSGGWVENLCENKLKKGAGPLKIDKRCYPDSFQFILSVACL